MNQENAIAILGQTILQLTGEVAAMRTFCMAVAGRFDGDRAALSSDLALIAERLRPDENQSPQAAESFDQSIETLVNLINAEPGRAARVLRRAPGGATNDDDGA